MGVLCEVKRRLRHGWWKARRKGGKPDEDRGVDPTALAVIGSERSALQRDLLEWLRGDERRLPLAQLYEGALLMLERHQPPGWSRFVAHAVREICNRLPDLIVGDSAARTNYRELVGPVAGLWETEKPPAGTTSETALHSAPEPWPISPALVELLNALLDGHRAPDRAQNERAGRLFRALYGDETVDVGLAVEQWRAAHGWAVGGCHDHSRPDGEIELAEVREQFQLFEGALGVAVRSFRDTMKEIDDLLDQANQRTD
jgi:hypothetical protein